MLKAKLRVFPVILLLVVLAQSTLTGLAFAVTSNTIASDGSIGTESLSTAGGEKLVQDPTGRMIAVYVDNQGRLGISFANGNPSVVGWSTPTKSPAPTIAYSRPAAVLASLTSLRIIVEGGSGSRQINDVQVTINRDSQLDILSVAYGPRLLLDGSGLARYPAATLAHNGDVLAAWNWLSSSAASKIKTFRWKASTGLWVGFNGISTVADDAIADNSNRAVIYPTIVERPDNDRVYLLGNRAESSSQTTLVFNKANFDGGNWSWGSQNLSYENNAARGLTDSTSLLWDASRKLFVAAYDVSGTTHYGVFTLDASDKKVHNDTPSLDMTNNEWGSISMDANGVYYIFTLDTGFGVENGKLGYTTNAGGSWSSKLTIIDSDTSNMGISVRKTGGTLSVDLVYGKGIASPATIKFVTVVSSGTAKASTLSFSTSPNPSTAGQSVTLLGKLAESGTSTGISGANVQIQQSPDSSTWTLLTTAVTGSSGSYSTNTKFSTAGTVHLRALFPGNSAYSDSVSPIVDQVVLDSRIQTSITISSAPNPADASQAVTVSGQLTISLSGSGLGGKKVIVEKSVNQATWTVLSQPNTKADGTYQVVTSFSVGTYYLRASFSGDGSYAPSTSTVIAETVVGQGVQSYALVVADDGKVFKFQDDSLSLIGQPTTLPLRQSTWRPDGTFALIVGHGATVMRYDGSQFTFVSTGISSSVNFQSVAWRQDGAFALISGSAGTLIRYDGTSVTRITTPATTTIRAIAWRPDGSSALLVGSGGVLMKYENGLVVSINSGTASDLYSAAWSTDGSYALIGGTSGTILKYDQSSVTALNTSGLYDPSHIIRSVTFNPFDNTGLVTGDTGLVMTYDGTSLTRLSYQGSSNVSNSNLYASAWNAGTATIVGGSGNMFSLTGSTIQQITSNATSSFRGIAWHPV